MLSNGNCVDANVRRNESICSINIDTLMRGMRCSMVVCLLKCVCVCAGCACAFLSVAAATATAATEMFRFTLFFLSCASVVPGIGRQVVSVVCRLTHIQILNYEKYKTHTWTTPAPAAMGQEKPTAHFFLSHSFVVNFFFIVLLFRAAFRSSK